MQNTNFLKIDVVIPAYNASKYIAETLQSVLTQTLLPNKVIVVDDGSTDNTLDVVNGIDSNIIEVISVENGGVSRARNIGIRASTADYIAFLDADDLWHEDKLKAQAEALIASPESKAVYSYAIMCDENGVPTTKAPSYKNVPYPPGKLTEKLLFEFINLSGSASSVMVESKILKSTDLFDEDMSYAEDIDLWVRLSLIADYSLVPKDHVIIRVNTSSATRSLSWDSKKKMISDHFYFMDKYARDYEIPKETVRISLTLMARPFIKRPHKIIEYFYFCDHLKKRAPYYFQEVSVDGGAIKLFWVSCFSIAVRIYNRLQLVGRLRLLFSERTIFFSKSKKNPRF